MEKIPSQTHQKGDERLEHPIHETAGKISYLGVTLEKATASDSRFVPDKERYADYVEDEFTLELQKNIAVALESGQPILIEGGTSLGKTTAARKMCAELGWEVHYSNLNGATDVEDLMGRYIPNPHKKSPEDPEFIFADGKVTSGLRQENGKTKVIILDEYNAAAPNIVIRLHEVLDALERDGAVVLSEDASEEVQVSKSQTKVVALMNPPGKGYVGREPLDPAQIRRWVYQKLPDKLPETSFSNFTKSLSGFQAELPNVKTEDYLLSNAQEIPREELQNIEGITDITARYEEFHRAAVLLVEKRNIASDQPQKFTFDDRMEPMRVFHFLRRFYRGDLNETFQKALRYFYSNKLQSDADREKLENLIEHVRYDAPQNTKRKALEDEKVETKSEAGTEAEKVLEKTDQELSGMKEVLRRKKREVLGEIHPEKIISAEYIYKDESGKEIKETIEIDFDERLKTAIDFYDNHDIELSLVFEEKMNKIWDRNYNEIKEQIERHGFDEILLVPENLNLGTLHQKMTEGYVKTYESDNFKKGGSFGGVVEKTTDARIVLLHKKGAESIKDHSELKKTLGKKAEELIESGESLTLTDYLILQKKFFEETGVHLDGKNKDGNYYWTWLPGSKTETKSGSRVVDARWSPDDGRLLVYADDPGYSNPRLGCRLSRSFS